MNFIVIPYRTFKSVNDSCGVDISCVECDLGCVDCSGLGWGK